jgi:hypothetical protein
MRRFFLLGLLVTAALLVGCPVDKIPEDIGNTDITIDDVAGEWDFENVKIGEETYEYAHLSIVPPTPEEDLLDVGVDLHLGHDDTYDGPFYIGDGTMEGNKFTGKYFQQAPSSDNAEYDLTVTFSLLNEELRAEFDTTGPLKGLVLKYGIKSED